MMVSTIHFDSILVERLGIISTFQDDWLHDPAINLHHGESYPNQESKKGTTSFSEEIQMCCTFKKSYSAVSQEFLRNRKRPQKAESRAISYGSNELQY